MNLDAQILALFKVVAPKTETDEWRSPRGWFRHVLSENSIDISTSTLHLWIREGVPKSRQHDVNDVMWKLYETAYRTRHAELQAVRATLGRE